MVLGRGIDLLFWLCIMTGWLRLVPTAAVLLLAGIKLAELAQFAVVRAVVHTSCF